MPHSQIKLVGSTLYIVTPESITAIDLTTDSERWLYKLSAKGENFENISVDQDTVYATCSCGSYWARLIALNARDGRERWRTSGFLYLDYSSQIPVVAPEVVFVKIRDCGKCDKQLFVQKWVAALDTANGSERWRFSLFNPVRLHGATDRNIVILGDEMPRWRNWLVQLNPAWH